MEEDLALLRQLDLVPPVFSFPVQVFDELEHTQEPEIAIFPRIPKWLFIVSQESGRVFPTESLVFSLIQELVLTQNEELGDFLFSQSDHLPDHLLSFTVWFSFVQEIAFQLPSLLVYVLGIVRPALFARTPPAGDIVTILITSLLCREVTRSPRLPRVLSALQ
jgi:hypothetical protein